MKNLVERIREEVHENGAMPLDIIKLCDAIVVALDKLGDISQRTYQFSPDADDWEFAPEAKIAISAIQNIEEILK